MTRLLILLLLASGGWERAPGAESRRDRLPVNWYRLRGHVKKRSGGQCEASLADGRRCIEPGTDCDHIVAGDNHDPSNLQWLCKTHHKIKTSEEANAAQVGKRGTSKHPGEAHPSGLKLY